MILIYNENYKKKGNMQDLFLMLKIISNKYLIQVW